jgi:hypothetical protein
MENNAIYATHTKHKLIHTIQTNKNKMREKRRFEFYENKDNALSSF